jgi:hypothetical protein
MSGGGEPEKGFQLTKQEDRFALEIDSPAEDDRVIRHEGAIALMVDQGTEEKKWAPYLLTWRIGPAGLS